LISTQAGAIASLKDEIAEHKQKNAVLSVVVEASDGTGSVFEVDCVLAPDACQATKYDKVSPFALASLHGHDAAIMSYGQTGSGKTYSMLGAPSGAQRGVIPRVLEDVMAYFAQMEKEGWTYGMTMVYVQIYKEKLYDLLVPPKKIGYGGIEASSGMEIKQAGAHVHIKGATEKKVDLDDPDFLEATLAEATPRRVVASTEANAESSRSHAVIVLTMTGTHADRCEEVRGTLTLVDLAGSESASSAVGQRLTEAKSINKSLTELNNVFDALARKQDHVPYRNSLLTSLLKPALSHGKALVLTNVSPEPEFAAETEKSLLFAQRVRKVELGKARRDVKYKGSGTAAGAKRTASRGGRRA